ncbi:MAG TPA: hypothetical protein VF627_03920 [Abditibacterium sp.]|jgi:hypothetical protein
MMGQIYLDLTNEFNQGQLRAILSSGQAVVVHGLALASKDGDWIVREDAETLDRILEVLEKFETRYRFGAPLDARWMRGGWSAHLEFIHQGNRIRCDFVARPPRILPRDLAALWDEQARGEGVQEPVPTLDLRRLAEIKKTDRERDYPFIGEIARRLPTLDEQILLSRSARDLMKLWPQMSQEQQQLLASQRPLLEQIPQGREVLETALDKERRDLARINEERLAQFGRASTAWAARWLTLKAEVALLPLREAHSILVDEAAKFLPQNPQEVSPSPSP